jgi:hypothetical protein
MAAHQHPPLTPSSAHMAPLVVSGRVMASDTILCSTASKLLSSTYCSYWRSCPANWKRLCTIPNSLPHATPARHTTTMSPTHPSISTQPNGHNTRSPPAQHIVPPWMVQAG